MALAGDDHVVVTVISHLCWPPETICNNGTGYRQCIALAFLATKAAAHAPNFDAHGVHWSPERFGHLMLDLGGVLRRALDDDVTAFLRLCKRGHPFQIEVLLPTDLKNPIQRIFCLRQRGVHIPLSVDARTFLETGIRSNRIIQGQKRRLFFICNIAQARSFSCGEMAFCDNQKDRHAEPIDLALTEHWLSEQRIWRDVVMTRQVLPREHLNHAGCGAHCFKVHLRDDPMCDLA